MKDYSKDIVNYHDDRVQLTSNQKTELRNRRDANRNRVRDGLKGAGDPQPKKFVAQGSFSMGTTIQEPDRDYDIDDGVVFSQESLQGPRGADKTALETRHMVCDAVDDGSFKRPPEIKKNCVRVFYNDGPHVDLPVYRQVASPKHPYELASSEWRVSDPEGVNAWFSACLDRAGEKGRGQLRRLIRLLKSFCANRPSYSLPSGFVLTVLCQEQYWIHDERLDRAFESVLQRIYDRLCQSLYVRHPIVDEWLIDEDSSYKTDKLRDLLRSSLDEMEVLDRPNCTRSRALKVWKKVLATDYFDKDIEQAESDEKAQTSAAIAGVGVVPKPYGHTQ